MKNSHSCTSSSFCKFVYKLCKHVAVMAVIHLSHSGLNFFALIAKPVVLHLLIN